MKEVFFSDEQEIADKAKEIFSNIVDYELDQEMPTSAAAAGYEAVIIIPDKAFPFTTDEPIKQSDGLVFTHQAMVLGSHIIFDLTLYDEDRTKIEKKFHLYVCPNSDDVNQKRFKMILENKAARLKGKATQKLKTVLLGQYMHKIQFENIDKTDNEIDKTLANEYQSHSEFMRHVAIGDIDILPTAFNIAREQIAYEGRESEASYRVVKNFCPTCKKLQQSS